MNLHWIVYTLALSVLLGMAALAAERAAHLWHRASRMIWAAAMLVSLAIPLAILLAMMAPASDAPEPFGAPPTRSAMLATAPAAQAASQWVARTTAPASLHIGPLLQPAWLALSATTALALGLSAATLARRQRRWTRQRIGGADVFVAPDAGPAVVGLLRPRIVLPAWLASAPPSQQALVMAHEMAHLRSRDPQLLAIAMLLLVAMPWNLPLWWQMRRLRRAIEIDCDARVLAAGHNLQQYGATLIDVGQRQSTALVNVLGMAASRSFLEQRIGIMAQGRARWRTTVTAAFGAMALCAVAGAAQLTPPAAAPRRVVQLPVATLDDYVGVYQVDEFQAITISRDGQRLLSELTGHDRSLQVAASKDHFFQQGGKVQLRFERDGHGRVVALTVLRMGTERTAPRVDGKALAQRIATYQARDGAMPGGEAALRRGADVLTTGTMFPEDLTPAFARQAEHDLPLAMRQLRKRQVGKMTSLAYQGVNRDTGEDIYRVDYEKVSMDWYLMVNSDGKIANARARVIQR